MGLYGSLWFETRDFVKSLDDRVDWATFVTKDQAERKGYHPTSAPAKIDWHVLTEDDVEMYRGTGAPIGLDIKPGDYLIRAAIKVSEDAEVGT